MGRCITRTNATTQPRLLTSTSRSWPRTRLIAHLLLKTFSSKFTMSVVFCVLVVLCWSAKLLVGMFLDAILLSAKLLAGMCVSRLPCLQNCVKNLLQQTTPQVTLNLSSYLSPLPSLNPRYIPSVGWCARDATL